MGDGGRMQLAGLQNNKFTIEFWQDFAASSVHATVLAALQGGTAVAFKLGANGTAFSATNPSLSGSALCISYPVLSGNVGDSLSTSVDFGERQRNDHRRHELGRLPGSASVWGPVPRAWPPEHLHRKGGLADMPVQIIGKHAVSPATGLKEAIEGGEAEGKTLITVVPFFDETALVWAAKPKRETATSRPAREHRG